MKRLISAVILSLVLCGSAQGLTLAELRFLTSNKLGQDTAETRKRFDDDAIDAWINAAIRTISKMALCYSKDTTISVVKQKTSYAMPHDYIRAEGVVLGRKGATEALDLSPYGIKATAASDMGKGAQGTGSVRIPNQFQDKGETIRKIVLTPAPSMTFDSATVTYFAYSRELTQDTMECTLPLAFQMVVPHLAAADAWSNTRQSNPFWAEFLARMELLVPASVKPVEPENPSATSP